MAALTTLPGRCATVRGAVAAEALATVALTIPMIIMVAVLAPVLLIGPFLSPVHRRLILQLLDGPRQWSLVVHGRAVREDGEHLDSARHRGARYRPACRARGPPA